MRWAVKENEKIEATPKNEARCFICNQEVISKCGQIKIWHWSHKNIEECDNWYEPESQWHRDWKNEFPKEFQEIKIKNHIADIKINDLIIELQNSPISSCEIIERELFYKNMIWILNPKTLGKGLKLRKKKDIVTFRWKYPPKSWWFAKKPVYIDINKSILFKIKKIYHNMPCGGWGVLIDKNNFLDILKKEIKEDDRKPIN